MTDEIEKQPEAELAGLSLTGDAQERQEDVEQIVRHARALGSNGQIVAADGRTGKVTFENRKPVSISWDS